MFKRPPKKEWGLYMKIRLIHNDGTLKDLFEKCKDILSNG